MSSYLARLKSEKRPPDVLPKPPKAPFDSFDSDPCRRFQKSDDHPRAWLQDGELRTTGPVGDLAAEIVKLTGDDMDLQKRLLLENCQAFQPSHIWRLFEQWEERAAILEHDAGLSRQEAEREAARLYHLTPWLHEHKQGRGTP